MAARKPTSPKPKPSYSPQTEQEIAEAMMNLALAGPRWIGEQLGRDLDEAFEIGETGISVSYFLRHPIKTVKKTLRKWTISAWQRNLASHLTAEFIWRPRLEHFVRQGKISGAERDAIFAWASLPESKARDFAFEKVEAERAAGRISDEVWEGVRLQHQWDEFSRFRRSPGRYLWENVFGKRGTKEAPLYKLTPQKWLGEPLGKYLGKTALGQAVEGMRQAAKQLTVRIVVASKQVVRVVGLAAAGALKQVVTRVAGVAAWTALRSAVGGVVGSLAGPVGAVVGFVAAPIATKLTKWTLQLACLGCGCASLGFAALIALIVMAVGGAFSGLGGPGGGGGTQTVVVEKSAAPGTVPVGPNQEVTFNITVRNNSSKDISNLKLVDDYDQDNISSLSVLGGGSDDGDKWTFEDPVTVIPPGAKADVSYRAWIIADADKTVVNNVTFTGAIAGVPVSANGSAFVIVGTGGEGRPPSAWPVAHGRITQGPYAADSHRSSAAIDIAPINAGVPGDAVKATHDGTAFAYYNGSGPYPVLGNYVVIESPRGFKSFYGHLETIAIPQRAGGYEVAPGQVMGTMGSSGSSSNVHLHYELRGTYQGVVVSMAPPFIPFAIGPCVGTAECDYEF